MQNDAYLDPRPQKLILVLRCRRLSELEQESEELRRKIRSSQDVEPHPSPIALLTAAAEMEGRAGPATASLPTSSDVPPISHSPNLPLPAHQNPGPELEGADLTKSRMLNGTRVTGEEIDDMFTLYVLGKRSQPIADSQG